MATSSAGAKSNSCSTSAVIPGFVGSASSAPDVSNRIYQERSAGNTLSLVPYPLRERRWGGAAASAAPKRQYSLCDPRTKTRLSRHRLEPTIRRKAPAWVRAMTLLTLYPEDQADAEWTTRDMADIVGWLNRIGVRYERAREVPDGFTAAASGEDVEHVHGRP